MHFDFVCVFVCACEFGGGGGVFFFVRNKISMRLGLNIYIYVIQIVFGNCAVLQRQDNIYKLF